MTLQEKINAEVKADLRYDVERWLNGMLKDKIFRALLKDVQVTRTYGSGVTKDVELLWAINPIYSSIGIDTVVDALLESRIKEKSEQLYTKLTEE